MTGHLLARTDFSSPQFYIASYQLIATCNDNDRHKSLHLLLLQPDVSNAYLFIKLGDYHVIPNQYIYICPFEMEV